MQRIGAKKRALQAAYERLGDIDRAAAAVGVSLKVAEEWLLKQTGLTVKQARFLASYAVTGSLTKTARLTGIHYLSHRHWLATSERYAVAFIAAREEAIQRLEDEARRRAEEGWDEPVFYQGKQCGTVRKFSDGLLQFLLKGLCPEKYRERLEHRVGPIDERQLNDEIERELAKLAGRTPAGVAGQPEGTEPGEGIDAEVLPALPLAETIGLSGAELP